MSAQEMHKNMGLGLCLLVSLVTIAVMVKIGIDLNNIEFSVSPASASVLPTGESAPVFSLEDLLRDVADSQHDERSTYCEMARNRQQAGEFAEAALMYAKCTEATEGRDESDLLFLSTALMNAAWTFNQANQDSESLHYAEEALIYIRKIGRPVVDPAPWLSG